MSQITVLPNWDPSKRPHIPWWTLGNRWLTRSSPEWQRKNSFGYAVWFSNVRLAYWSMCNTHLFDHIFNRCQYRCLGQGHSEYVSSARGWLFQPRQWPTQALYWFTRPNQAPRFKGASSYCSLLHMLISNAFKILYRGVFLLAAHSNPCCRRHVTWIRSWDLCRNSF